MFHQIFDNYRKAAQPGIVEDIDTVSYHLYFYNNYLYIYITFFCRMHLLEC